MSDDALIKEARAECAQKYLLSYWFSFSETGSGCIDEILSQIARAGKAYHSTEYWTESEDGDPSHADLIQDAAIRAANIIDRLADALTAANAREAALRKEAAEAIWQAYKEGCNDGVFNENDNTSKPGRFFCYSASAAAAQRIGGAE